MSAVLSIGIAVLNAREDLELSLASIAEHLPADRVEVIIADGGSTDGTEQWLLENQPAEHLVFGPDRGVYDAMNAMVERSSTPYILFLGAGDRVLEGLAEVLAVLPGMNDKSQGAGEDAGALHIAGVQLDSDRADGVPAHYPARWNRGLWWRHITHHQGVMYPTDLLRAHPYDPDLKVLGDYAVDLLLFQEGVAAKLHGQIAVRAKGGGLSQRFTRELYCEEWRIKRSTVPPMVWAVTPLWLIAKFLFKRLFAWRSRR
jgi:glycosyltransferase involved in cell wall biosynthesis